MCAPAGRIFGNYVDGGLEPGGGVEEGLHRLPGRMSAQNTAQQLASQARKAKEAVGRRDQLIRQMRGEGSTLRAIAEVCGLTHTAVAKILKRG